MADRSSPGNSLPTIVAALLAALFGVRIATQSGDDAQTSQAARPSQSHHDEDDDRSEGWKLKFGKNGSLLDAVPARPEATDPHKHHPFLQPLADFTGRSLSDFEFAVSRYQVRNPASPTTSPVPPKAGWFRQFVRELFTKLEESVDCDCARTSLTCKVLRELALLLVPPVETPKELQAIQDFLADQHLSCRFLIASVPSPADPKQAYSFDLWVEALQRAVAARPSDCDKLRGGLSYVLDSFWLPWVPDGNSSEGIKETYKTLPGLLLFRSVTENEPESEVPVVHPCPAPRKTDLLLVFLVGETPTAGIRKEAFTIALDFAGQCQGVIPQLNGCDSTLKILGPAYSGSQKSLENLLVDWCKRWKIAESQAFASGADNRVAFDVISTGTALKPKEFQESVESCRDASIKATLRSTLQNDDVVVGNLFSHLYQLHKQHTSCPKIKVVNLVEYNTSFGARLSEPTEKKLMGTGRLEDNLTGHFTFVDAPFPAHISEVHRRRDKREQLDRQGLPQVGSLNAELRLPLLRESAAGGIIPELGGEMTTVLEDLVLAQLVSVLKTEDPQYVLIGATDVRDLLFLAGVVRTSLPGAQILLTESHLLFLAPENRKHMLGSIIASTYPMAPDTAAWGIVDSQNDGARSGRKTIFSHSDVQGLYNATLFHLNKESKLLDYAAPLEFQNESRQQSDLTLPGTWISRIGSGELFPIQFVPARKTADKSHSYLRERIAPIPKADPNIDPSTRANIPWYWIGVTLALALALPAYLIFAGSATLRTMQRGERRPHPLVAVPGRTGQGWMRWWLDRFDDTEMEGDLAKWIGSVCFRVMATLIPGIIALHLASVWNVTGCQASDRWRSFFSLIFTLEFKFAALITILGCLIPLLASPLEYSRKRAIILMAALALSSAAMVALQSSPTLPYIAAYSGPRVTSLFTGINPVIPTVLLGIPAFWWPLWRLTRINAMLTGRDPLILPDSKCRYESSINTSRIVTPGLFQMGEKLLIPSVACLACTWWFFFDIRDRWLPTPDGASFDRLIQFTAVGLSTVIVVEIVDFLWLWRRVESVHNRIASLPMQAAFAALPQSVVDKYGSHFVRIGSNRKLIDWERQQLKVLRKQKISEAGLNSKVVKQVKCQISKARRIPRRIADLLFRHLSAHVWSTRTYDSDLHAADPQRPPSQSSAQINDGSVDAWNMAAENLLALMILVDISRFRGILFHQALFLGVAPIAMFLAVNSYPFQPQWSLTLLSLILIVASGCASLYVVVGMNRDELLSRISRTQQEWFSFNWDFFSPAMVGLLPILVAVVSQLPGVGDPIVSFLGQLVRGLQLR